MTRIIPPESQSEMCFAVAATTYFKDCYERVIYKKRERSVTFAGVLICCHLSPVLCSTNEASRDWP